LIDDAVHYVDTIQLQAALSAFLGWQRANLTEPCESEVFLELFLPCLAVSATTQVIYRDLLPFTDIFYSMDRELIESLVPEVLCIVVTGVIDPTCFEENTSRI
jgi:hypothetical protein